MVIDIPLQKSIPSSALSKPIMSSPMLAWPMLAVVMNDGFSNIALIMGAFRLQEASTSSKWNESMSASTLERRFDFPIDNYFLFAHATLPLRHLTSLFYELLAVCLDAVQKCKLPILAIAPQRAYEPFRS